MGTATLSLDGVLTESTQVRVQVDEEFRQLNPPLSRAELASLEAQLKDEGCLDPLKLWQEEDILLDGYNRHSICTRLCIRFQVCYLALPDRDAARDWILRHQSARRNLTSLGLAYLRGERFELEKSRSGGTGANQYQAAQRCQNVTPAQRKTAVRLGEEYRVSARTILRDACFVRDVDLVAEGRTEIKRLILSRDARLTRRDLTKLREMDPEEREAILAHLLESGEVSRPWARQGENMVLSRTPETLVPQLWKRLEPEGAEAVYWLLGQLLEKNRQQKDQDTQEQAEERS